MIPDPQMALPEGKTCRDCYWFRKCRSLLNLRGSERGCVWFPRSRFIQDREDA
jgi:hypothetical protein